MTEAERLANRRTPQPQRDRARSHGSRRVDGRQQGLLYISHLQGVWTVSMWEAEQGVILQL